MTLDRLRLALRQLRSSDWSLFEEFASSFLASEFDSLQTTASPSGDEGRDAQLFSPVGEPTVVLQYSVTPDWEDKITKTAKRISTTLPDARALIYVSNHVIGPAADKKRKALRQDHGLSLDVRDQSWFLDRCIGDRKHEIVAEQMATRIVDPFLKENGLRVGCPV